MFGENRTKEGPCLKKGAASRESWRSVCGHKTAMKDGAVRKFCTEFWLEVAGVTQQGVTLFPKIPLKQGKWHKPAKIA